MRLLARPTILVGGALLSEPVTLPGFLGDSVASMQDLAVEFTTASSNRRAVQERTEPGTNKKQAHSTILTSSTQLASRCNREES